MTDTNKQEDVTEINVGFPDEHNPLLKLSVGACRLRIRPGEGELWVAGSYHDPTRSVPVKIVQEDDSVRITQRQRWGEIFGWLSGVPQFDLTLGAAKPYRLLVESGASEHLLDLGGLPITRLELKHGAGKVEIDFSEPNPQPMSMLQLGSGAGSLEVKNLANANFAEMALEGGAAAYRLDFGGSLSRDGHVKVSTGVSSVEVRIPGSTAAKITSDSVLGSLNADKGFVRKGSAYWTQGAVEGHEPGLTIHLSMALGSLQLRLT